MSASVEDLYCQYGPMVLRRCRALVRDEERAVEAMHEVFVQVLRSPGRVVVGAGSSYLFRLATNVSLNILRGVRRSPEDADDELALAIAGELDIESRAQARNFLARLFADEPETSATIAVLHYVDNMTWEEVAREVNMSVSGVRKRMRGIQQKLEALQEKHRGAE